MSSKSYTFIIASNHKGTVRKLRVPGLVVRVFVALLCLGGLGLVLGAASYGRLAWRAANYRSLQNEQAQLEQRFQRLQTAVQETNQRFTSLESLATEVAMSYGVVRFQQTPFGLSPAPAGTEEAFERSLEQFSFLASNARAVTLSSQGQSLYFGRGLEGTTFAPTLWPVVGRISGSFGERLDPFTGEGGFHRGVDISTEHGAPVRATADGIVIVAGRRSGYGRLVGVDHGFGLTTWYGHLSRFGTHEGARIKRGDVIGYVGVSGRTTAPHVHYEVRINGMPVNPWRYLRTSSAD
jgi:murein DD-endopeptidase MepM/ murein hydrolase activator NlpD